MAIVLPLVSTWDRKGVDQATQDAKEMSSTWGRVGDALNNALIPATAAFAATSAFAVKAGTSAADAAVETKKLNQVYESMGYPELAKGAAEYAEALALQIGVDDEIIKASQTKLATFRNVSNSADTMARATAAAADLSAAGFGSMETAAVMLGKALNDPVKGMSSLSRVGIQFTKQQQEQIKAMAEVGDIAGAQAVIFEEVERQVGGVAEASSTAMGRFKVQMDEFMEAVGTGLAPVFGVLIAAMTKFAEFATRNADLVTKLTIGILGLTAAVIGINAVMAAYKAISAAASVVTNAWAIVIIALVAVLVIAYKRSEEFRSIVKALTDVIARIAAAVVPLLTKALTLLLGVITRVATFLANTFGPTFQKIFGLILQVVQRVMPIVIKLIEPLLWLLEKILGVIGKVLDGIGKALSKIPKLGNAAASVGVSSVVATGGGGAASFATPVVINVSGALDPERVARQIRRLLDDHDVRQGRLPARTAVAW